MGGLTSKELGIPSQRIHKTISYPCPTRPGVDIGTFLTGPHVSYSGLVPQVAHFRLVTPRGSLLKLGEVGVSGIN